MDWLRFVDKTEGNVRSTGAKSVSGTTPAKIDGGGDLVWCRRKRLPLWFVLSIHITSNSRVLYIYIREQKERGPGEHGRVGHPSKCQVVCSMRVAHPPPNYNRYRSVMAATENLSPPTRSITCHRVSEGFAFSLSLQSVYTVFDSFLFQKRRSSSYREISLLGQTWLCIDWSC